MSTFSIIIISTAAIAVIFVITRRTKKILAKKSSFSYELERLTVNGSMTTIVSYDKKLFSLDRGYVTLAEIINYRKTKSQQSAICKYIKELKEVCLHISGLSSKNLKEELQGLQIKIHDEIDNEKFVGKFLTSRQINLLTETRSESNTIESLMNSAEKINLERHYVLAICLLTKVKNIDAFK